MGDMTGGWDVAAQWLVRAPKLLSSPNPRHDCGSLEQACSYPALWLVLFILLPLLFSASNPLAFMSDYK